VKHRTVYCPACRCDVPVSRWTGRAKLHVGNAIGERVFCNGRNETHGGTS